MVGALASPCLTLLGRRMLGLALGQHCREQTGGGSTIYRMIHKVVALRNRLVGWLAELGRPNLVDQTGAPRSGNSSWCGTSYLTSAGGG